MARIYQRKGKKCMVWYLDYAVDGRRVRKKLFGRSDRTKFQNAALRPLLNNGLLEMSIPDKPRSSLQRYRSTKSGKRAVATGWGK